MLRGSDELKVTGVWGIEQAIALLVSGFSGDIVISCESGGVRGVRPHPSTIKPPKDLDRKSGSRIDCG